MANIIDVLLSTHDKEEYHSRVLTWLVDPNGSHGFGRAFFDKLIELAFPGWEFDEIQQVRGELCLDSASTVDIGVLSARQMFMIENKTRFSSISSGQVERYLATAKSLAADREIRLIHLLPGPQKKFSQLEKHEPEVAVIYWSQIAELLQPFISKDSGANEINPSVHMYYDYIIRTIAQGGGAIALHPDHPRMSLSRSGFSTNFNSSRGEYLAQARLDCENSLPRLDLIHALIGFLENLRYVRVEYKKGNTHWNVTGSIPRSDGGVTVIVQCWANGRICYEYRRLPDALADEYRRMTFDDFPKRGWREVWIETLPLEQTMHAIRIIATKASSTELPVVP